ncbi:MAG: exodeoxyribonuclease VII small subunit [Burkholderiales bacterium]|nr:exodeoxyribonuclease VII small subunit [Burkholderiales bacterium]
MAKSSVKHPVNIASPEPANFEAAMTEIEQIVVKMEEGALPLAEALEMYQRGATLLVYCQKALREAQQQVRILEDGVLKEFDDEEDDDA